MKDFFVHRTARGLVIPFVTLICVLLAGAEPARAAKNAYVEVGFVGAPPPNFQNVLLNVQSVRINTIATAGPGNAKWQNIPVPPGIGGAGQGAELQIDLNASQNVPQLFNTSAVRAGTYKVAQVLLDPNNPGTLVPNCPLASPLSDGCINYPMQLTAGTSVISVTNTGSGGLVQPAKGQVAALVLQLAVTINSAPTTPGAPYMVTVTLASPPANPLEMGTVTGSVTVKSGTGTGTSSSKRLRKLTVTAQAIGTNAPVASALVKNGQYTLLLPAAGGLAAPGFGTLYDLAVSGGTNTFAADRLPPLYPGQSLSDDFGPTGNQTINNISGTISDNCVASKPIVGATVQLLIPPNSAPSPLPTPAADYCISNPAQCVAVATANTDNTGFFPLPGTLQTPAEFDNVPTRKQSDPYAMEITAPGYDPLIVEAVPGSNGGTCECPASATPPYPCTASSTFTKCDLLLNTGYIRGTIPIQPPNPGQSTLVQVFAEDAGTNNVESALAMPVTVTSSNIGSVGFTLNVPPSVPTFDLFATTIDLYQGVTDPYQGHNVVVLSDVTGPAEPTGPGACSTATAIFEQMIDCGGHGSVTGSVANANLGTSVVLSKQDMATGKFVQITNSQVQNQSPNSSPSNRYTFCAPAGDTYGLQMVQMPMPSPSVVPSVAPSPEPVGTPTTVMIPTPLPAGGPSPTPTPAIKCPTTCSYPNGQCPGICNTVIQPL